MAYYCQEIERYPAAKLFGTWKGLGHGTYVTPPNERAHWMDLPKVFLGVLNPNSCGQYEFAVTNGLAWPWHQSRNLADNLRWELERNHGRGFLAQIEQGERFRQDGTDVVAQMVDGDPRVREVLGSR